MSLVPTETGELTPAEEALIPFNDEEVLVPFDDDEEDREAAHRQLYKGIGERLRAARLRSGARQREVALAARISRSMYVAMEHGRGPIPIDRLIDVCAALGVSAPDIIWPNQRQKGFLETLGWDRIAMIALGALVVVVLLLFTLQQAH